MPGDGANRATKERERRRRSARGDEGSREATSASPILRHVSGRAASLTPVSLGPFDVGDSCHCRQLPTEGGVDDIPVSEQDGVEQARL